MHHRWFSKYSCWNCGSSHSFRWYFILSLHINSMRRGRNRPVSQLSFGYFVCVAHCRTMGSANFLFQYDLVRQGFGHRTFRRVSNQYSIFGYEMVVIVPYGLIVNMSVCIFIYTADTRVALLEVRLSDSSLPGGGVWTPITYQSVLPALLNLDSWIHIAITFSPQCMLWTM